MGTSRDVTAADMIRFAEGNAIEQTVFLSRGFWLTTDEKLRIVGVINGIAAERARIAALLAADPRAARAVA